MLLAFLMRIRTLIFAIILITSLQLPWGGRLHGQELPPSRDEVEAIIAETTKAIEEQPKNSKLYYRRALIYKQLGQYENALDDLRKATRLHPRFAHAFYERGLVSKILEKYDLAEKSFRKAVKYDSSLADAYEPLDFDLNKILEDYRSKTTGGFPASKVEVPIKGAPESYEPLQPETEVAVQNPNKETIAEENKPVRDQHTGPEISRLPTTYETRISASGAAVPSWRNVPVDSVSTNTRSGTDRMTVSTDEEDDVLVARYHQAIANNDASEALRYITAIIGLNPDNPANFLARSKIYRQMKNIEDAKADIQKAYSIDSENSEIFLEWGLLNLTAGNLAEAQNGFDSCIAIDPNNADAYLNRAMVWHRQRNKEKAEVDYSKVIELIPNEAIGYYYRCNFFLALGRFDEAMTDIDRALELNEKFANAYFLRGEIHSSLAKKQEIAGIMELTLQHYRNAAADYNLALTINPANKAFEEARNKAREMVAALKGQ